jgi:hypothetical protein
LRVPSLRRSSTEDRLSSSKAGARSSPAGSATATDSSKITSTNSVILSPRRSSVGLAAADTWGLPMPRSVGPSITMRGGPASPAAPASSGTPASGPTCATATATQAATIAIASAPARPRLIRGPSVGPGP